MCQVDASTVQLTVKPLNHTRFLILAGHVVPPRNPPNMVEVEHGRLEDCEMKFILYKPVVFQGKTTMNWF